jgi:hypothetical protein
LSPVCFVVLSLVSLHVLARLLRCSLPVLLGLRRQRPSSPAFSIAAGVTGGSFNLLSGFARLVSSTAAQRAAGIILVIGTWPRQRGWRPATGCAVLSMSLFSSPPLDQKGSNPKPSWLAIITFAVWCAQMCRHLGEAVQ